MHRERKWLTYSKVSMTLEKTNLGKAKKEIMELNNRRNADLRMGLRA